VQPGTIRAEEALPRSRSLDRLQPTSGGSRGKVRLKFRATR
jgi:hypothetical protein